MAEGKDGEETDGAAHAGRPDGSGLRPEHDGLPAVESPPLSLTDPEPERAREPRIEPKPEPEVVAAAEADASKYCGDAEPEVGVRSRLRARLSAALAQLSQLHTLRLPSWPRFSLSSHIHLKPRQRRRFALAATVVLAAALGAVVGALFGGKTVTPTADNTSRAAIAQLTHQVAALEAELAASKAAAKKAAESVARTEARKIVEAEVAKPPPDVTGSIPPPGAPTPIPPPRPVERIAAAASRPPVLNGWRLRLARNGLFLVEGRGDIYQVVPGAPLPGVGPVQAIRRQDGRWVVVTPKGLIVSLRDRRHFE